MTKPKKPGIFTWPGNVFYLFISQFQNIRSSRTSTFVFPYFILSTLLPATVHEAFKSANPSPTANDENMKSFITCGFFVRVFGRALVRRIYAPESSVRAASLKKEGGEALFVAFKFQDRDKRLKGEV